jgi:hypothetical protein
MVEPGERMQSREPQDRIAEPSVDLPLPDQSMFEAPAGKYDWLKRVIAIGVGHRFAYGPV